MKRALVALLLFFVFLKTNAQDVIIKNDKTEIEANVLEITEDLIKYKKFEFQEGPIYNLKKSEVFLIIYKNGFRETFNNPSETKTQSSNIESTPSGSPKVEVRETPAKEETTAANVTNNVVQAEKKTTSSQSDKPIAQTGLGRLTTDINSLGVDVFSLRLDTEIPVFRRNIYVGVSYIVSSYLGEGGGTSSLLGINSSFHLPVNGMFTNDKTKTLKGFKPFIRPGIYTDFSFVDFSYDLGVDWLFFNRKKVNGSWGLSLFTTEFTSVNVGAVFTWK